MSLIHVTDHNGTPCTTTGQPLPQALVRLLARHGGPVVILVHGYKYDPAIARHCPHRSLFAPHTTTPLARCVSWPERLGHGGTGLPGPTIGFGWSARGSLRHAYANAAGSGATLAALIGVIRSLAPHRPVHLLAHSLGARVALTATRMVPEGAVGRVLLLAAADYKSTALGALSNQGCDILNVTSRENDLFDAMMTRLVPAQNTGDRMLGAGLTALRATTLRLDNSHTLDALAQLGYPVAPASKRVCHWSSYLREGVFPLYRALLGGSLDTATLRAALPASPRAKPARPWNPLRPRLPAGDLRRSA